MTDTQETGAEVIAEYRADADKMDSHELPQPTTQYLRIMLDRLEAAHRRERGDCAKLREALAPFPSLCEWLVENAAKLGIPDMVAKLRERGDKARAALAATEEEGGAK